MPKKEGAYRMLDNHSFDYNDLTEGAIHLYTPQVNAQDIFLEKHTGIKLLKTS